MGTYRDMYDGGLGVIILSEKAFKALYDDINDYVISGKALVEKNGQILKDSKRRYYWVRPKFQIGPDYNSIVKKVCEECHQAIEVRKEFYKEGFLMNVEMATSYNSVDAPIALSGNWYGDISRSPYGVSQDTFISGWLHEKICGLNLKGHVEAENIIHSAEEFDFESIFEMK